MSINWQSIIDRAHGMALEKGWWQPDAAGKVRSLGECLTLIHSEISEACEAYREFKGDAADEFKPFWESSGGTIFTDAHYKADGGTGWKPVGIPSELADVCIRVCDLMGFRSWNYCDDVRCDQMWSGDFLVDLNVLHVCVSDIGSLIGTRPRYCSILLAYTASLAAHYGIDLAAAIEAKLQYNATRPHRHGKRA